MANVYDANVSVQFTGNNLSEIGTFLAGIHFEYTGESFIIPTIDGNIVIKPTDWVVIVDGIMTRKPDKEMFPPLPKKRGKKK